MFEKLIRFFWGLVLVPLTLSTLVHLPSVFPSLKTNLNVLFFLSLGVVIYILFEMVFSKPMRTYVFGHEAAHALASMLMGGKVNSFNVSSKGGSVSVTKTNFLVALAPYCIPLYTFLIFLVYYAAQFWVPANKIESIFLALIGCSLAFHGSLTIFAIRQEQPDIQKTGFFFSLVFILLCNGWVLVLLSKMLFWNSFSIKIFFLEVMKSHAAIWQWLWKYGLILSEKILQRSAHAPS